MKTRVMRKRLWCCGDSTNKKDLDVMNVFKDSFCYIWKIVNRWIWKYVNFFRNMVTIQMRHQLSVAQLCMLLR